MVTCFSQTVRAAGYLKTRQIPYLCLFSLIGIISFSPPNGKTALPHPGTAAVSHPLNGSPPSSPFSLSVLIKGAFKYKASATTTSAKCPCLFLSRSIRRFPPYLSRIHPLTLTFPAPSITCGAFPIVMHTMSR